MTTTVKIETAAHGAKVRTKLGEDVSEVEMGPYSSHIIFLYGGKTVEGISEVIEPVGEATTDIATVDA